MADHVIKQVRDAVIARLTGLATTAARVHEFQVNALESITDLPALNIVTEADEASPITVHSPIIYERSIDVSVSAYASANSGLSAVLDAMRKEVEAAMGTALVIGPVNLLPIYRDGVIDVVEGERAAGELKMRFTVSVSHTATAPDVLL